MTSAYARAELRRRARDERTCAVVCAPSNSAGFSNVSDTLDPRAAGRVPRTRGWGPDQPKFFRRSISSGVGFSSANDPVFTAPARAYDAMTTPDGELFVL